MVGFVQTIGGGGSTAQEQKITCFVGQQNVNYDIEGSETSEAGEQKKAKITRHQATTSAVEIGTDGGI